MRIPLYQVDAFAEGPFTGNPAAVCPLDGWLSAETMQAIAAENNLSETAFLVAEGEAWRLRWFTPTVEVDLCGHATLAAAHVIFTVLAPERQRVLFRTDKAGDLAVTRERRSAGARFPVLAAPALRCTGGLRPGARARTLRDARRPRLSGGLRRLLVTWPRSTPDFPALARLDRAVIATAPGPAGIDFVSRFFAPAIGVDEDPVTGSAHCMLIPYWAGRLGRTRLRARQLSRRGGSLVCELRGERVAIAGRVIPYLTGAIEI